MYAYVHNNPTTLTDPSGLFAITGTNWAGNATGIEQSFNQFWNNGATMGLGSNPDPDETAGGYNEWRLNLDGSVELVGPVDCLPQGGDSLCIDVSSDTTIKPVKGMGVYERVRDYTVGTMNPDWNFEHDTTGKHFVTGEEKLTGGNEHPLLIDPKVKGIPTLEDRIHVSGGGKWFTTVQTFHIDANKANALIYEKYKSGIIVSGTHVYVHATAEHIDANLGP